MSSFLEDIPKIESIAKKLNIFADSTVIHIINSEDMYELYSYGLPNRFSHWSFGKQYWRQKYEYDMGMSKVYELVINTTPAHSFYVEENSDAENRMIYAHVLGHIYVFRNNFLLKEAKQNILETLERNARMIQEYEDIYGYDRVEWLLDRALSIQYLSSEEEITQEKQTKQKSGRWDDLFSHEQEKYVKETRWKLGKDNSDILGIIANYGKLEEWERNVLNAVREESIYIKPNIRTKVLNEGFASWAQTRIMRELDIPHEDVITWIRLHSSVVSPRKSGINPYYFGFKLLEHIENKYGVDELLKVVELEDDASLVRNYVDEEFVRQEKLFTWIKEDTPTQVNFIVDSTDWKKVRDKLAHDFGTRLVSIVAERGSTQDHLILRHIHNGDLEDIYTQNTLKYISELWGSKVSLCTMINGSEKVYSEEIK